VISVIKSQLLIGYASSRARAAGKRGHRVSITLHLIDSSTCFRTGLTICSGLYDFGDLVMATRAGVFAACVTQTSSEFPEGLQRRS
jgi:hypothetical protein